MLCVAEANAATITGEILGGEIFTLKINQFERLTNAGKNFNICIGYAGANSKETFSLVQYGSATPYNLFFNASAKIIEIADGEIILRLKVVKVSPESITLQFFGAY